MRRVLAALIVLTFSTSAVVTATMCGSWESTASARAQRSVPAAGAQSVELTGTVSANQQDQIAVRSISLK